jgi:hypothetical protein
MAQKADVLPVMMMMMMTTTTTTMMMATLLCTTFPNLVILFFCRRRLDRLNNIHVTYSTSCFQCDRSQYHVTAVSITMFGFPRILLYSLSSLAN